MWGDLPQEYKKKLNILTFAYLPILLAIALILSLLIANLVQLRIDFKSFILVLFCFLLLYFVCLFSSYKESKSLSMEEKKY